MSSGNHRFRDNVIAVFGFKVLIYFAAMVVSVFLARILSQNDRGIVAVSASITGVILQFGNLGLHSANTYYIARNKDEVDKCMGGSIFVTAMVGLVSVIACVFFMFNPTMLNLDRRIILLSFLFVPVSIFSMFLKNIFIALSKVMIYNILELLESILYPLIVAVFYIMGTTINADFVLLISLCAAVGVVLIGLSQYKYGVSFSKEFIGKSVVYGIKSYASCIMAYLVLEADILMLNYFLSKDQISLYSLASSLGKMIFMVSSSVTIIMFPYMGRLNDYREVLVLMKKVYKVMVPITLCLVSIVYIFSPWVVTFLYGKAYAETAVILRFLLPGIFCWSLASYLFIYFANENRYLPAIIVPGIGFLFNIVLNMILIPRYGNYGAAVSSDMSYLICLLGMLMSFIIHNKRVTISAKE